MFMKRKININANRNYRRIKSELQELTDILEESKLKDKLFRYEIVRIDGKYNMLSQEARQLVGLDIEDYTYIIQNYSELMKKYPEIKEQAFKRLEDIKSVNKAKANKTTSYNKLDIKNDNLYDNCKNKYMQ